MSNLNKTLTFVGVAAVLTGAAAWSRMPSTRSPAAFNDQGQKFFPDFNDPMSAKVLEVIAVDESTGRKSPFQVVQDKDGRWRIPSHNDYPADAKDRLGKTAGGVIDLAKDTIRSDDPAEHPALGVVDPEDKAAISLKGMGQRVTLRKSAGGEVLADFIIGKAIPNKPGYRYVRVPGQKRTYGVKVDVDLSARFADWIETNLLKLESSRLRAATFNHNHVDPIERMVVPGDILPIRRPDGTTPWTTVGLTAEQELDPEKLSTFTSAISDLKIIGIRPKPKNLVDALKSSTARDLFGIVDASAVKAIDPRSQQVIPLSAGFYLFQGVGLLPSQAAVPLWVILSSAAAMALGTAVGGWRIIKTMGSKLVDLTPAHGFAAETAAAAVILVATHLGLPISTTHVIASSILGVGATRRANSVRWGTATNIMLAWVLTIPGAGLVAGLIALAVRHL